MRDGAALHERMGIELTDADHAILTLLATGRCTVADLVESSGYPERRIRTRLAELSEAGHVRRARAGSDVYELVEDPR